MFNNPLFEFEMKSGKGAEVKNQERKFNPLGNFQLKKINEEFKDF